MMRNSQSILNAIYSLEDQINDLYSQIGYDLEPSFFLSEKKEQMLKSSNELSFKNIIFYLYKLYYERGKLNIDVISDYAHLAGMDRMDILNVRMVVHDFRTKYGHFLNMDKPHDKAINKRCRSWVYAQISKEDPENEREWKICGVVILEMASDSLEAVKKTLSVIIQKNEAFIYEQWWKKQKRNIPQYKKIEILDEIKQLYQLPYGSMMLYQKKQHQFDMILEILDFDDISQIEPLLKEQYIKIIQNMDIFPLPLTGKEVAEKYGVSGKQLEGIMKQVQKYYKKHPNISKEELFSYIDDVVR